MGAQDLRLGVEDVLLEAGVFSDTTDARTMLTLRATPSASGRIGRDWEWRAGVRLGATRQSGGPLPHDDQDAVLADTWVRWRTGDTKLTAGLQTVLWGRVDEVPLIDRVSRVDASRLLLDNLPQRRLPQPIVRWEQAFDTMELDVVLMPSFQGAKLADSRNVWSPVDQQRGVILGIAPPPALAAFISSADLRDDDNGHGGAAVRLTQTGAGDIDWGLTAARTRQSLPYYVADPVAGTLTATHPFQRFLGADLEFNAAGATWRSELGLTWDARVTATSGQALKVRTTEWVGAVEFFPGGEDLRMNLQLAARKAHTGADVLELREYAALGGEVEDSFDQGRWKLAMRFNLGLNVHDVYLGPRVTFSGWEPHDVFLAYHHFRGEARTLGGFHRDHSLLTLGLRTRF
ncbi:DUF1302 family protein [Rubrivivax albus]|uniref:DUF3570 domain-containing protein n=1 Tax=Rubrivivax albus TaxID=2499835 RepID=A0A3S2U4L2_9BURK|nr:DUF1302 family protein [Rubrivivax albus]RVT53432.1 hypothetical protein ENE75_00580 [Rubrivivax albus]